jgi:hypothetical protein
LELSMILAAGGNIQAAHYQAFLVAEEIAGEDQVGACNVLKDSLEVSKFDIVLVTRL